MECYRHPGAEAVESCVVCQRPVCETCRETVAGHAMCRPCVEAEQARLQSETAAEAPAAAIPSAGQAQDPATATLTAEQTPDAVPLEPCGVVQYVKAVLFAGAAAVVGAVIWDKFVLWTGIQFGLVAVAVGWVVAVALCMGAENRPGKLLPWLGALMAGFGIMLGNGLLLDDAMMREMPEAARRLQDVPYLRRIYVFTMNVPSTLDLMDWVFVAIGVWEGWSIPNNLNRRAEVAPTAEPESPAPA